MIFIRLYNSVQFVKVSLILLFIYNFVMLSMMKVMDGSELDLVCIMVEEGKHNNNGMSAWAVK